MDFLAVRIIYGANLLTLNSSETEFLLIGHKQQLSNIQDCSLTTTHSSRNLGFIFDEYYLPSWIKSLHFLSLAAVTSVNFAVSAQYLDFKTASTIATSTVHSKLDYCNSLYDNLPNMST